MRLEQRRSFPRRMVATSAKVCVAIAALVGAANWAAKGYPERGTAPGAVAALPADEPVTTGSIGQRPDPAGGPRVVGGPAVASPAKVEKPVEKIVARVPDFDQRALAQLAAGAKADTTPAAKPVAATAKAVARRKEAAAH